MSSNRRMQIIPSLLFFLILLSCLGLSVFFLLHGTEEALGSGSQPIPAVLVIDPGHGGIDGGAVSDNGSKESDINLSISLKLREFSELLGIPYVMTRTDDSVRCEYADYSEHEDLVRRTSLVNNTPGAVLISIHQNDFPTGQPSGSQVLYAASPGSEAFGKLCHKNLISYLDPQNRRVAAPAPKNLYITSHISCPAILVECGFMSNNYDVQKLCDEAYQRSLALILAASFLQYTNKSDLS